MRPRTIFRTVSAAAISLLMTVPVVAEDKPATNTFNTTSVDSFAGAMLAARTAEADRDLDTAIDLYRKALNFERDNTDIRQRLMILLFSNGNFDEALHWPVA